MLTVAVLLLLTVTSVIAPIKIFGFKLKQANIYSDVVSDSTMRATVGLRTDLRTIDQWVSDFGMDVSDLIEQRINEIEAARETARAMRMKLMAELPAGAVAIEDFSESGYLLEPFYEALKKAHSDQVRIAVLGDSFIEGDIMTADLREMFQNEYSGAGVGYMPITSQVNKFRGSVVHSFGDSKWHQYSLLKESSRGDYALAGHTFQAKEDGAWVEYTGNKFRKHLSRFQRATLLFINRGGSKITAIVNDSLTREFTPATGDELQSIAVEDSIHKVRFEVSNVDGFTAYGALLDNATGVCVDNYSIRGHAGTGLLAVNEQICAQMSRVAPYDLIILEYGLNVVEEDNLNYGYYRTQMTKVIDHIKLCYPDVPIVLMGVSDRSTMRDGSFVTMPGVVAMDKTQRDLARKCGITFWSSLEAMRSLGGMPAFVENGWASKDYTHLGNRGGQKIAQKFYEAIKLGR